MTMTSRERVLTALSHKEPDRVPLVLNTTMQPARDLGISLKSYLRSPDLVARGILESRKKYGTDAYIAFHYGAVDYEAFGGDVIFRDDGPPNSGMPIITTGEQIDALTAPDVSETPCLQMVLEMIRILVERSPGDALIFGVAISPLSLPVMQMGFENYIRLMYTDEERFRKLIAVNSQFFVEWASAQVKAGVDGIIYFDPVSSPTIIPPEFYRKTGLLIARDVLPKVNAPIAAMFASARIGPILDDITSTGVVAVGVGESENIREIKQNYAGKVTLIGNLNGIAMRHWTREEAFSHVKELIRDAGPGGGFIVGDNHGEIPFQVSDEVLFAIRDAVMEFGRYPIPV